MTKSSSKKNKRSIRKIIKRTVLASLAALIVVAATTAYLIWSEPGYWKEHQRFIEETSPKEIEALADKVDDKISELANLGLNEATDPGQEVDDWLRSLTTKPDTQSTSETNEAAETVEPPIKPEDVHINVEKTLTLSNDEIAAVVKTRLDDWMDNRGYVKPEEVKEPMVAIDGDKLVCAFRVESNGFSAIISGKFTLNILDNGMAELLLDRFYVGKLPVPADMLGNHLHEVSGGNERLAEIGEWLGKLNYLEVKPVLELEHRRRARVMDYKILDDSVELSVRIQDHKTYKSMNQVLADVPTRR